MEEQQITRYKFLRLKDGRICSQAGACSWTVGKWHEIVEPPDLCEWGFHCSVQPLDAFRYVQGEILAMVEVGGRADIQEDKQAWQRMRLEKVYRWQKKDSVQLAIYAARLVLHIFEERIPGDMRPRKAIEAAEKWVENPSAAAAAAAAAAYASAYAAAYAYADAAAAAYAYAAAYAAASAAADARKEISEKINTWMVAHIAELEVYEPAKIANQK